MSARRFVGNVIWNWIAIAVNIATGIILTPFILKKLGEENFGLWAFAISLAEYEE